MTKADFVSGQVSSLEVQAMALVSSIQAQVLQAISDSLGAAYDAGVASVPPPDANEQAKIDAAVKAAVDPLNAQIALVQQSLSDEMAKEASEAAQIVALQAKLDQIKSILG